MKLVHTPLQSQRFPAEETHITGNSHTSLIVKKDVSEVQVHSVTKIPNSPGVNAVNAPELSDASKTLSFSKVYNTLSKGLLTITEPVVSPQSGCVTAIDGE